MLIAVFPVILILCAAPVMGQLLMSDMLMANDYLDRMRERPVNPPEEWFEPKLTITSMREKDGLCDPSVAQFAGYFDAGPGKSYFFWFFESRTDPKNDPTVMWLTGGPGCSSQLALLGENGPCTVNKDGTDTIPNEQGRSCHYIPAISHKIFIENQKANTLTIKLEGVAIGNGMTDPEEQYKWYPDMAYNSTTAPSRVSEKEYEDMKAAVPGCVQAIQKCNKGGGFPCSLAFMQCNRALFGPYQSKGLNPYDMRQKCEHPPLCYDFSNVDKFLNTKSVQEQLGVNTKWQECNTIVNLMFNWDFMHNFHSLLVDQIEGGLRVLIYAGDVDYICNWIGNKHWALELEWKGQEKFKNEEDKEYKDPSGTGVGKLRSVSLDNGGQFTFLQVYQAGHMVPMDQPAVALTMLNEFIDNEFPTSTLERPKKVEFANMMAYEEYDLFDNAPIEIDIVL
ncbi:hypothetical protein FOL47_001827 [Perkinsus chesapeaki]|uniref:Uncharacterized protein n=1 Tax=Perkinsus chesapeaki TaxID=330153 RepID=A0A7J6MHY8_PERCH|nr:hypothetical protein FOL47_001827 [Perkinsus chesapeaki]